MLKKVEPTKNGSCSWDNDDDGMYAPDETMSEESSQKKPTLRPRRNSSINQHNNSHIRLTGSSTWSSGSDDDDDDHDDDDDDDDDDGDDDDDAPDDDDDDDGDDDDDAPDDDDDDVPLHDKPLPPPASVPMPSKPTLRPRHNSSINEHSTQNAKKRGTERTRRLSKSAAKHKPVDRYKNNSKRNSQNDNGNDMEVTSLEYYTLSDGRICITPTTKSKMEHVLHEAICCEIMK